MLTLILWLLFGAFIGWLASLVMARDNSMGTVANIVVGIIGASLGGFLFNREVTPSIFSGWSILTAFIGAVILLAIVNLITRGRVK